MKSRTRIPLLLATAAAAAGCSKIGPITAPALNSGRANFSVVAALGTSITAGYQSGGLVDRHQTHSYAVLFAQRVGAHPLDLPLIGGDGIPPLLEIKRLAPPPVVIAPISATPGSPTNFPLPTAYHNMSIPGALLVDATDTTLYQLPGRNNPFFGLIQRQRGPLALQVARQLDPQPTFVILEYGANELLGPAVKGTTLGIVSNVTYAALMSRTLAFFADSLPNARLAIVNVPDITTIPFFNTLSNRLLDAQGQPLVNPNGSPRFVLGPSNVALTANDRVLLTAAPLLAAGFGYPVGTTSYLSGLPVPGNGLGLGDSLVLSSSEAQTFQIEVRNYNTVIDTSVARRDIAVVDLRGLLRTAATTGFLIQRVRYTSAFVTGGVFSLDGVHPNDLGHALLCNELIAAVNTKFGSNVTPIDPTQFATLTASRAGVARAEPGLPPWLPAGVPGLETLFAPRGLPLP
ncbi:MAG TPA: SGNH/GDSL hydrolase family protein [Candidatus Eisenbacteria bacterium]|jgi:lysophospholipase L1-like esterase